MATSVDQALQTMIDNMPEKTGKSLEEWKQVLSKKGYQKHGEAIKYLKTEHQVSHGFANTIVSLSKNEGSAEVDLVSQQYTGKENLLPIYQELIEFVRKLGSDVIIAPKKGTVSIIRKHQFLLIKPATKTRIDLGFKLKDFPVGTRLENSGPFGSMCSHRVQLMDASQVDSELKDWIQTAYHQSV
ncbi:MAG: DUF4287 domain-containing protein [Cyclobacteriaceae bacterium]|jgi:hypothetical protein